MAKKSTWRPFFCCLALLLPLNDVQGEICGSVEATVLKNQLQTGKVKKARFSAVKDSRAINVTLEEGEQEGDNTIETDTEKHQNKEYDSTRCH